jgi:hypothetical protein
MWRDYFPNALVHGLDVTDPGLPPSERVCIHTGDQSDRDDLARLVAAAGSDFDLIIDDGGHTMGQQQTSFGCLFPHVSAGGAYIIEDLHTSFMDSIGLYAGGRMVGSYPTGVSDDVPTTYDIVAGLASGRAVRGAYMTENEYAYISEWVETVILFDRDDDRAHITSLITKRP